MDSTESTVMGVQLILQKLFVPNLADVNLIPIKKKDGVVIDRMILTDSSDCSIAVIVKHLAWEHYFGETKFEVPLSLQYESAAYQFLLSIRKSFNIFPQIYSIIPGVIIMEDLGSLPVDFSDEKAAQFSAVELLAKMHSASIGKRTAYEKTLKTWGVSTDNSQDQFSDKNRHAPDMEEGLKLLSAFANRVNITDGLWLDQVKHASQWLNNVDGRFDCFIHSDFVSLRQTAFKNDKLHLFDFGHARFGHAFIDLLQIFIGKIECNHSSRSWCRKAYTPVEGVFDHYRMAFEKSAEKVKDSNWLDQFSGIAILLGVSMLGSLVRVAVQATEIKYGRCKPATDDLKELISLIVILIGNNYRYLGFKSFCQSALDHLPTLINVYDSHIDAALEASTAG